MDTKAKTPASTQPGNQAAKIPRPRSGDAIESETPEETVQIDLFTKDSDLEIVQNAVNYIERKIEGPRLKLEPLMISLLETIGAIPSEIAAEEQTNRKAKIDQVEEIITVYEGFNSDRFDKKLFDEAISFESLKDTYSEYVVIQALTTYSRANRGLNIERRDMVVELRRVAMIGIAKQLGAFKETTN